MAYSRLRRIGEEGFRMIDQYEEQQRCQNHPTKPTVHYLQPPPVTQIHTINTPPRGSAGHHTYVTPAPVTTRDQASAGAMDCYEAARRFGGTVVTDFCPNKKLMMMVQRNSKGY